VAFAGREGILARQDGAFLRRPFSQAQDAAYQPIEVVWLADQPETLISIVASVPRYTAAD
jgi:hypothetical protein